MVLVTCEVKLLAKPNLFQFLHDGECDWEPDGVLGRLRPLDAPGYIVQPWPGAECGHLQAGDLEIVGAR